MDSDIWLPLATLILGWAGAQVTEVLRDRRTTTRERLARQAELQRTTLLELQEGLHGLFMGFLAVQVEDVEVDREPDAVRYVVTLARQASEESGVTRARMRLLVSRVDDARVRELVTTLVKAADTQLEPTEPGSAQTLKDVRAAYLEAVARIGELLRERY